MGSVKKALNWLLAGAFLLVCALALLFFAPLTETGGSLPVLSWESAELRGPDGEVLLEPKTPQMTFTMELPRPVPPMSFVRHAVALSGK